METCGMTCIKYLLFAFNFLFALSGVGIITAGALVLKDADEYDHFVDKETLAPPIVLIVTGSIVFIIAFLGCCGAIKESPPMLYAFAVLLIIIFIVELAIGIAAAANKESINEEVKKTLKKSMSSYQREDTERNAWAKIQRELECCGVDGPNDWPLNGNVPSSCCKNTENVDKDTMCQSSGNNDFVHQTGCYQKLSERLKDGAVVLMGVGIGIAFIELAGAILACFLAAAIKRENAEEKE